MRRPQRFDEHHLEQPGQYDVARRSVGHGLVADEVHDFFHAMLDRFPTRLNPGALWGGAVALYA